MIGQYTHYSISFPSFHTYTYINKFCDDIIFFFLFFFYIRKIQDTDDWTLMAVLLVGSFTSIFDKTRNMLLYIDSSGEQDLTGKTGSMCKTRDVKGWDEKGTNRRGRAFIQKIVTPFSSCSPQEIQLGSWAVLRQPHAWLTEILTDGSAHRVKKNNRKGSILKSSV